MLDDTAFLEVQALTAALKNDGDEDRAAAAVDEILDRMLPGELRALGDAAGIVCGRAYRMAREKRRDLLRKVSTNA